MKTHVCWLFFLTVLIESNCYNMRCPNGFVAHDTSCYKFVNMPSTWAEAKVLCDVMDSHLVEIDSPWEEQFILERLYFIEQEMANSPLWIGATDMMNENEWIWMTSGKRVGYRNWKMEEAEALVKGHGHCLAVTPKPEFVWSEINCRENLNFICEINMAY